MRMKASKTNTSISIRHDFSSDNTHKNRYITSVEEHSSPLPLKEIFFKGCRKASSQVYTFRTFILQLIS